MSDKTYYIKREELQKVLTDYKQECIHAQANSLPDPKIPEYIGECFVKIATKLSYRPNFIGYTFKDEMVSDGIENCLLYFRNYDPAKSDNPFGYFTKIIWFAFLRRIAKEKRELSKKYKYIENMDITDIVTQEHDNGQFTNVFVDYLKSELDLVDIDKRIVPSRTKVKGSNEETNSFDFSDEESFNEKDMVNEREESEE